jgi:hypothetical protein
VENDIYVSGNDKDKKFKLLNVNKLAILNLSKIQFFFKKIEFISEAIIFNIIIFFFDKINVFFQ